VNCRLPYRNQGFLLDCLLRFFSPEQTPEGDRMFALIAGTLFIVALATSIYIIVRA